MSNNDLGSQLSVLTEMKKVLGELPGMFEKLGTSIGGQSDPLRQLTDSMEEATDTKKVKDMDNALKELSEGLSKAGKNSGKYSQAMKGLAVAGAAATGAFRGFTQGLSGTFSMIGSLTSSVFNLAKAGVGALMASWEGLVGVAYSLRDAGDAVAKKFEALKKDFGSLASNEGKAVIDAFKELRSAGGFAAQTGIGLRMAFGGEFAAGLEQVASVAREMGTSFGQLKEAFVQNATALVIMNQGLGLTGEALAGLALQARSSGESMTTALTETTQMVMHLEKQFGVDGKLISKNLDHMAKNMTKFGHMSREQLTATATYATKLGISIESLGATFDKFENFEDAATGAAKMSEAFGMNVDAMAMMNAESPAEQMDMMRQAFNETGKSLDDMSRSEKAYLEELTGLKGDELYKAFDPANADIGFDDMLDAANEAADKVSPEEAMLQAAEKIERSFDRLAEKSKGFFDAFTKGFLKGATHGTMMNNPLKKLSESLDKVYKIGYKLGTALFGKGGAFSASNTDLIHAFNDVLDNVVTFFESLSTEIQALAGGDITVAEFFTNMGKHIDGFLQDDAFQDLGAIIVEALSDGIQYVMKELPGIFDMLTQTIDDVLTGKTGPFTGFDALGGKDSPINSALTKAFAGIADLWPKLSKSFGKLLDKIGEAAMAWAMNNKMLVMKISAVLFGPAILGGMIGLVFSTIGALISTVGIPMLTKSLSKAWKSSMTTAGGKVFGKAGAISNMFAKLGTNIQKMVKPITNALSGLSKFGKFAKLFKFAFSAGLKFLQPVISGTKTLYVIVTELTKAFFTAESGMEFLGNAVEIFFGSIMYFALDVAKSFTDLIDLVAEAIASIFDLEVMSISELIFGKDGPMGIFNDFRNIDWGYIPETFLFMGQEILSAFDPVVEFFGEMGDTIATKFDEVFSAFTDIDWGYIPEMIYDSTIKPVMDGFDDLFDIDFGEITDNLIDGLKNMPARAAEQAWETAKGMGKSFMGFFGISSPSKYMEEMGNNVVDGMAIGTEGMEDTLKGPSQKSVDKMSKDIGNLDTSGLDIAAQQLQGITRMAETAGALSAALKDITLGGGAKKMKAIGAELSMLLPAVVEAADGIQSFQADFGGKAALTQLVNSTGMIIKRINPLAAGIVSMSSGFSEMLQSLDDLKKNLASKNLPKLQTGLMAGLSYLFGDGSEGSGLLGGVQMFFEVLNKSKDFDLKKLSTDLTIVAKKMQNIARSSQAMGASMETMVEQWALVPEIKSKALKVQENVADLVSEIEKVNAGFNGLDTIEAIASVQKVAAGLAGDGNVVVQHEGLNIQVHFKVNIDSKDLAAALGDDAEGGPFFVINTDREAGGTESAEAAGE
jgi:hypothetical protein